jgi:beta-fructofuranosidase
MNDPNGPVYFRGLYHMFFQYNPNAAVWGDMHWAHAVSPDMLHWKHLPVALAPTPQGPDADGCFSGSAILHHNTPTILYTGVKSVSPAEATLGDGTHNFLETQCLATSSDPELRTWRKQPRPVLLPPSDSKLAGFRDPCLWQEKNLWYMGIGSGQHRAGGQVLLYRSADLLHWESLHPLAHGAPTGLESPDPVDAGDMWECPDFFPLNGKHVLLYSTQRKVFWEVGEYDPQEHLFHSQKRGLLDYGAFYAPKSQLDAKGRRILWGWIPESRPEAEFSAAGWAGCMSLPRVLSLNADNEPTIHVVDEIADLNLAEYSWTLNFSVNDLQRANIRGLLLDGTALKLKLVASQKPFNLALTDQAASILQISYDPARAGRELQLNSSFVPLPPRKSGDHHFTLFLDASVVECLADNTLALTTRVYRAPQSKLRLAVTDADLSALYSLAITTLKPISPDRLTT